MRVRWRRPPPRGTRPEQCEPRDAPFVIAVDRREQAPYSFGGLRDDASRGVRPLRVRREVKHLETGDYSIVGCEQRVAVERKSLEDLYSTLGRGRDRFYREVQRLAELECAAIVVEAPWAEILLRPPVGSRLRPKTVFRTAIAWMQRGGVPWVTCAGRRMGEVVTYRWLERWWRDNACASTKNE